MNNEKEPTMKSKFSLSIILGYLGIIVGYFLLIPGFSSVLLFIKDFQSAPQSSVNPLVWGYPGHMSVFPIYFGLMSIAGVYLICNGQKRL